MKKHTNISQADAYRKQFWSDAAKHLPHHAAVKVAKAIRNDKLVQYGYRGRQEELGSVPLKTYPEKELEKYRSALRYTKLWHGTGRYQHGENGTVDVLAQIVQSGGLRPLPDSYAVMLGGDPMMSLSATPLRMIARSYADIHGKGASEENRYGSALWWASYYYGPFYAQIFTKNAITIARHYRQWHESTSDENGERTWGKKVNKNAKHVWDVFGLGSDIAENYPILIGMKEQSNTAPTPKAIAKAEVRLTHVVPMNDITHLEVPAQNVPETETLLKQNGYDIPVLPIELGEYAASKLAIAELLHP